MCFYQQQNAFQIRFLKINSIFAQELKIAMQNFKQKQTGKKGAVKFSKVWNT